jgi:RNA polymerase sigma-70 factor (ECF subfamily)
MSTADGEDRTMSGAAGALELGAGDAERGTGPDAEVVAALGRGELREAVVLCARAHGAAVGRLCQALLGSQADAEDALQETLLDAYRGIGSWRAEGSLRAWLCGIARRKCAKELERGAKRRAKLRVVSAQLAEGMASLEAGTGRRAEQARALLGELRPSEREAVVLRLASGLGYREVGEALGIDEAAARKRVSRGLATLRSRLDEQGREP